MTLFIIILTVILFVAAALSLLWNQTVAPAIAFLGLVALGMTGSSGYPVLPVNSAILISWLSMTVVVMIATMLQPQKIRGQRKGMGYILGGGICGMAVGLLGFTVSTSLGLLYGIMITATLAGIFFGFLIYANTPDGSPVNLRSGNFFKYLLAKGFPTAITVMQIGTALVLAIALYNASGLGTGLV